MTATRDANITQEKQLPAFVTFFYVKKRFFFWVSLLMAKSLCIYFIESTHAPNSVQRLVCFKHLVEKFILYRKMIWRKKNILIVLLGFLIQRGEWNKSFFFCGNRNFSSLTIVWLIRLFSSIKVVIFSVE